MSALVVTGTDTGAGKTLVTAAIAAALRARGMSIGVAKPAETGCPRRADGLYPEDAATLAAAAAVWSPASPASPVSSAAAPVARAAASGIDDDTATVEPLDAVCPYRFPDPLAPMLAAARVGTTIDVDALVRTLTARAVAVDILLIEGAGGVLVPLTPAATYADLARMLDAPVLLVVGSRLGAINHALLSLEALRTRAVRVLGYVVNRLAPAGDLAVDTNTDLLRGLTADRFLGELPHLTDVAETLRALREGGAAAHAARTRLAALASAHIDLDALVAAAHRRA